MYWRVRLIFYCQIGTIKKPRGFFRQYLVSANIFVSQILSGHASTSTLPRNQKYQLNVLKTVYLLLVPRREAKKKSIQILE